MRKLCFLLTALLLTAPALAGVDVNCSAAANVVTISYVASDDANLPRAFGLDITVDGGATFTGLTDLSEDFWVHPGTIDIVDGNVIDEGTPLASGTGAKPGLGSNGITIEMGSLYASGDPCDPCHPNPPPLSGDLVSVTLSGSGTVHVTITGNAARGNVVLETVAEADVDYGAGCDVTFDCFPGSDPKYAQWVTQHKPKSWCCAAQWLGDATGDGKVTVLDLYAVKKAWGKTFATGPWGTGLGQYNCAADFNHSGNVTVLDLYIVKNHWGQTVGPLCADIGDCPSGP